MDEQFGENSSPHVLVTENGGASLAEIELPWDTVSEEVMFLNKVDSLKYENGVYYLTLGQGEYGNKKADFTSTDLKSGWKFEKSYIGTVHLNG